MCSCCSSPFVRGRSSGWYSRQRSCSPGFGEVARMKQRRERGLAAQELGELDDLLQHRARVTAAVLLARHDQLSFSRLKELLDETDGNLGAHLRRLEDAG